jgi:hypothetical protein
MSLKNIYAPTMAYWIKWGNILVEREKKQKEHEVKWIKRREDEWENYWEEQSTRFGEWEVEETEQEGM